MPGGLTLSFAMHLVMYFISIHADGSHGLRFFYLHLSVYSHDISKTDGARIQKCSATTSPGNQFILEPKGQRSRSRVTNTLPAWVFALLRVLASSDIVLYCLRGE